MKLKEDVVFDHETRKLIYNHIITFPGVAFPTLKNTYKISDGTLRYHLKYLEKAEQILSDIENGRRCYYPLRNEFMVAERFKNKPRIYNFTDIQLRIIKAIKNWPGISQGELIKKTNLSRFTVAYNIRKFMDMGLIKKSNNGKNVHYEYMTDEVLRYEVLLRLTLKLLKKEISEKEFFELNKKLIGKLE
ncbi:MAG: winged helix-turn-helix transcriptional regulator [Thermoplasmata archaeon]|nr:winged helix-turn-helix transcriptional regulator [Thermoplasmata archaeon]